MVQSSPDGVSELSKSGKHRHDDARALFNAVRWRGAMYIAGYSAECLLKTKLMRMFGCSHLRELEDVLRDRGALSGRATVFTHELELLLDLTKRINVMRQNAEVWKQFNLVNRWMPAWRYSADQSCREDAEDFLESIQGVLNWIEHNV
jgi:HEPN domain-containing protein